MSQYLDCINWGFFSFSLPAFQWQFQQAPSLTACWWQDCTRPQVCRLHRALEVLMLLDLVSYPDIYHQELSMVKQHQILFFETSVLKGSDIDDFRVTNLKRFLCCLLDVRWLEISHVTKQPNISKVWQSFYSSPSVDAGCYAWSWWIRWIFVFCHLGYWNWNSLWRACNYSITYFLSFIIIITLNKLCLQHGA